MNKVKIIIKAVTAVGLLTISIPLIAASAVVGVLGLYEVTSETSYTAGFKVFEVAANKNGCEIKREGIIVGAQGKIKTSANRFFVLKCDRSIIASDKSMPVFSMLKKSIHNLVLSEGDMRQFGSIGFPEVKVG